MAPVLAWVILYYCMQYGTIDTVGRRKQIILYHNKGDITVSCVLVQLVFKYIHYNSKKHLFNNLFFYLLLIICSNTHSVVIARA